MSYKLFASFKRLHHCWILHTLPRTPGLNWISLQLFEVCTFTRRRRKKIAKHHVYTRTIPIYVVNYSQCKYANLFENIIINVSEPRCFYTLRLWIKQGSSLVTSTDCQLAERAMHNMWIRRRTDYLNFLTFFLHGAGSSQRLQVAAWINWSLHLWRKWTEIV